MPLYDFTFNQSEYIKPTPTHLWYNKEVIYIPEGSDLIYYIQKEKKS